MKIIRKTSIRPDIPTASMADIAFLLIIFFMVTTVFSSNRGLELALPREEASAPTPSTEDSVFLEVHADSSLTVDCRPIRLSELMDHLEAKLGQNPDKPVILHTSPDAPYQAMISIYDALVSAEAERGFKVKNLSIPTQRDIDEYVRLFGSNPLQAACP